MKVYLELQPDYFNRNYSEKEYSLTLNHLQAALPHKTLYFTQDKGFTTVGRISALWQRCLGFFGFTNRTHQPKVELELLKFLLYGVAKNFIKTNLPSFSAVRQKVAQNELRVSQAVKNIFDFFNEEGGISPQRLHTEIQTFYREKEAQLVPSFWDSLFMNPIERTHEEFGGIYLSLAEQFPRDGLHNASILEAYKAAAALHNSLDPDYSGKLIQSFKTFNKKLFGHTVTAAEQAPFDLLCAKRAHWNKNMERAFLYFQQVDKVKKISEPVSLLHWADAAIQTNHYKEAEQLLNRCAIQDLNSFNQALYAKLCSQLGDHFFKKKSTVKTQVYQVVSFGLTPSPNDHCLKARSYYEKALPFAENSEEIRKKIVEVSRHIFPNEEAWKSNWERGTTHIQQKKWDSAAAHLLIAMQSKTQEDLLTTPSGQKTLHAFTQTIQEVLKLNTERGLELLDKALECIGDMTSLFQVEYEGILKKKVRAMQCLIDDLVTEEESFKGNVGARLHYLKAKVMRSQPEEFSQSAICEEFMLAAKLAKNNPFGVHALFMEDPQSKLAKDLTTYQELAEKWL